MKEEDGRGRRKANAELKEDGFQPQVDEFLFREPRVSFSQILHQTKFAVCFVFVFADSRPPADVRHVSCCRQQVLIKCSICSWRISETAVSVLFNLMNSAASALIFMLRDASAVSVLISMSLNSSAVWI